jgi:peptidoglycan/LPS O-acetylase OafA/YrhL
MERGSNVPRLDFLDALRALAALWVVHYHLILIPQPNLVSPTWAWLANLGGMGVTLFFVVSAFSLCHTMPVHEREGDGLSAFYLRRFFRIAPLFYVMLAFYFWRDIWLVNLVHTPGEVLVNALFIFNLIPGEQNGYVWASWTIGVEMLFYALFPFVYMYFDTFAKSVGLVVLCAAVAWLSYRVMGYLPLDREAYYGPSIFRHLPVFAMGIVAFHAGTLLTRLPYRYPAGVGFIAAGLGLMWALITNRLFAVDSLWWQGVSFALLLTGLLLAPLRLVVNRVTSFLGKTSYSLYLVHPTLVLLLVPVYRWIYAQPILLSLRFACCSALTLALLVMLSYLTYRWIERPGIELGRYLLSARTNRALRTS